MEAIQELTQINYIALFISIFTALVGIKFVFSLFEWVITKLGLETKWMRQKREEHELLLQTSQKLQKKHQEDMNKFEDCDNEIRNDLKKLTDMFIDKEINDMRWEINNFANKISDGKKCNKDSFKHCIHTYEKYEKILKENNLENGEVEISIEIINEAYKQKLKEGI